MPAVRPRMEQNAKCPKCLCSTLTIYHYRTADSEVCTTCNYVKAWRNEVPIHIFDSRKDVKPAKRYLRAGSIENTPEWLDLMAIFARGLKPFEFMEVEFSPETRKRYSPSGDAKRLYQNLVFRFCLLSRRKAKELKLDVDIYSINKEKVIIAGR